MLQNVKGKLMGLAIGAQVAVTSAIAADAPTVPATALSADYSLFDYVFAGVIGVSFVFMVARRAKGFIR